MPKNLDKQAGQIVQAVQDTSGQEHHGLDLATAAQLLGITPEALRKRLQRGRIKGFKTADGTWRVHLSQQTGHPGQADSSPPGQMQAEPNQQREAAREEAALVASLREEVTFLRSQLQARDEEVRRAHILLQHAQQQALQLVQSKPPRRRWWHKLFS